MCGIVAVIGKDKAYKDVLEGLKRLEYRGYDSSGIAYISEMKLNHIKSVGKLSNLITKIDNLDLSNINNSNIAVGHTRWATHGKVDLNNAHPMISNNKIAVVHNGIIENYKDLKKDLLSKGYLFDSLTDTEVIPHLFDKFLNAGQTFFEAGQSTLNVIDGAFAFAAITNEDTNKIFVSRKTSPLVIGLGDGFNAVGSDAQSISHLVDRVIYLEDGDYALITDSDVKIFDKNNDKVNRTKINISLDHGLASKEGYRHFMEKEIFEQPSVLINTISSLLNDQNEIIIDLDKMGIELNKGISICAAGTSHYAAMVGKYWIEKLAGVQVNIDLASEYRYRSPVANSFSSMIVISQSGESIDTLMAMREAKKLNLKTCAIINVEQSTIDREADYSIYTRVGPEIGVASTKSFTSQLTVLFLLALKLAQKFNNLNALEYSKLIDDTKILPSNLAKLLKLNEKVITIAHKIKNSKNVLFLGRGNLYPIALEGALKLKEISYIHAEGFAAGEMKHGPIALIEEELPVIMFLVSDGLEDKSLSNLQEAISRGANTILISDYKCIKKSQQVSLKIEIPTFDEKYNSIFAPIFMSIPAQLLAYHVARERGTDVDQPRNLAKSVTVE